MCQSCRPERSPCPQVGQNQLHKFSSDLHTSALHTNAHRPLFTNTCLCKCSLIRARTHVHTHTQEKKSHFATTRSLGTTFFFSFCHFPKINALHCWQASRKKGETCNFPTSPTLGQSPVVSTGTVVRGFLIPHRPYGKFGSSRICYKPQTQTLQNN